MAESSGLPDDPDVLTYQRMADFAESLLDEIAGSSPDWCRVAADADELARIARPFCEHV